MWVLHFCLLLSYVAILTGQKYTLYSRDDSDDDDDNNCLPKLADDCFKYVAANLNCHLNPNATNCKKKDEAELCSAINGGLKCAQDIIDNDCNVDDGRDHFDLWMKGLETIYRKLCSNNMQLLKVLVDFSHCWDNRRFIKCLEEEKNILHVVDFLKIDRNLDNCYHLTMNLASCSTQASSHFSSCVAPHNAIKELLHTFFTNGICSGASNNQHREEAFFIFSLSLPCIAYTLSRFVD